jgi:hypothetical protein
MIPVNTPHVDITNAKTKFDAQNKLADQASLESLRQMLVELRALALRLKAQQPQ